jgi:hypothetical protein
MRFASLFWRMPSERSGKSHKRKAANHIREKWQIASEKNAEADQRKNAKCRFFAWRGLGGAWWRRPW